MSACSPVKTKTLIWKSTTGSVPIEYYVEKSYNGDDWFYIDIVKTEKITLELENVGFYIRVIGVDKLNRHGDPSPSSDNLK